jgi:hypothetical protein
MGFDDEEWAVMLQNGMLPSVHSVQPISVWGSSNYRVPKNRILG